MRIVILRPVPEHLGDVISRVKCGQILAQRREALRKNRPRLQVEDPAAHHAVGEHRRAARRLPKQRELAETRNTAENAAYAAEKQLGELGDQVDESSRTEIEAAIKEVRDSLTSEDTDAIKAKTDALQGAFHKVSEQIYQAAAEAQSAEGASTNGASSDEEVVDAEVVDDERA